MTKILQKSIYLAVFVFFAFSAKSQVLPTDTSRKEIPRPVPAVKLRDSLTNYRKQRVMYKPTRIYATLQDPLSVGFDQEFRIVSNYVNLGINYQYNFHKDDAVITSMSGLIYLSLYLPVNRLLGNYARQNKGLFVFGNAGYGGDVTAFDAGGDTEIASSSEFRWRVGADFFIVKGFGVTFTTNKFKTCQAGLVFHL